MTKTIIFLNGTSSSGKTTIARAFQKLYYEPCLYASVDAFIFMFADHVRADDAVRRRVLWPVLSAFHRSLPVLADCGFPVIVDHVLEAKSWIEECARSLHGYRAFLIGVHCPLPVLEERERNRGDRQIGFARWQFDRVHSYGAYDLDVDSSREGPEEIAKRLVDLIRSDQEPKAFKRIRRQGEPGATDNPEDAQRLREDH